MIKILENSIDFSKLGNHTKEELKSEVKRAVILQESWNWKWTLILCCL